MIYIHLQSFTYIYIHLFTHIYIHLHKCTYIYIHLHTYIYIYIILYIYIHLHTIHSHNHPTPKFFQPSWPLFPSAAMPPAPSPAAAARAPQAPGAIVVSEPCASRRSRPRWGHRPRGHQKVEPTPWRGRVDLDPDDFFPGYFSTCLHYLSLVPHLPGEGCYC